MNEEEKGHLVTKWETTLLFIIHRDLLFLTVKSIVTFSLLQSDSVLNEAILHVTCKLEYSIIVCKCRPDISGLDFVLIYFLFLYQVNFTSNRRLHLS